MPQNYQRRKLEPSTTALQRLLSLPILGITRKDATPSVPPALASLMASTIGLGVKALGGVVSYLVSIGVCRSILRTAKLESELIKPPSDGEAKTGDAEGTAKVNINGAVQPVVVQTDTTTKALRPKMKMDWTTIVNLEVRCRSLELHST